MTCYIYSVLIKIYSAYPLQFDFLKSEVGLSPTYVKLAMRLCSVLPRQLTNQNRGHKRVMLEY